MKIVLVIIWSIAFFVVQAEEYSMRRCLMLPITDTLGSSVAYKVFEKVEDHLKESTWCQFQPNYSLIEIFGKYRDNLREHLQNPEVIKVVANKMQVGSIIRIHLQTENKGIEITFDVVSENGEDVLFQEKSYLEKPDSEMITQTITNWLQLYESFIPYDGRVVGVLGDQVTIDVGQNFNVKIGQEFRIKRMTSQKRHPLLKKIVEWEAPVIAKGKVFNVSRDQSLGMIKIYVDDRKLKVGDWVKMSEKTLKQNFEEMPYSDIKANSFGKLGLISLNLEYDNSAVTTKVGSESNKKLGGGIWGFNAKVEAWVTRSYMGIFEYGKRIGTLKKTSGSLESDTNDVSNSTLKLGGGFKYLPLGFFLGPQVDFYGGLAKYTYGLTEEENDGFGENTFSGLMVGVGGNLPIQKEFRVFGRAEIVPFAEFESDVGGYGSAKKVSSMLVEVGGKYQYNPLYTLDASLEVLSNRAKFNSDVKEVTYADTAFKFGVSFNF
jgi:hypothetical protein